MMHLMLLGLVVGVLIGFLAGWIGGRVAGLVEGAHAERRRMRGTAATVLPREPWMNTEARPIAAAILMGRSGR